MNSSKKILRTQRKTLLIAFSVILCLFGIIFYAMIDTSNKHEPIHQLKLELPGDKVSPQDVWMTRLDNDNKVLNTQIEFIQDTILELKNAENEKRQENDKLRKEVEHLRSELKKAQQTIPPTQERSFSNSPLSLLETAPSIPPELFIATEDPFVPANARIEMMPPRPVFKELIMGKAKRNIFHVDKAIPAGTSVKALLVSSIDAPCGIYAKTDPQPVKLRILDNGHLPNNVEAKLKGGLIIASAYGDISTERVYMRIERLTKIEENGEFIETSITGFVSGEDGKFGVRGSVVDKSEKIVANAARSGFFGGASSILQSAVSRHEVNQFSFDVVKQGCANGASNAFDMLSDYYIRRAEQVMPVIQVTAGRIVDVTFIHQAELGDLYTKEKVKEIREESRRHNS